MHFPIFIVHTKKLPTCSLLACNMFTVGQKWKNGEKKMFTYTLSFCGKQCGFLYIASFTEFIAHYAIRKFLAKHSKIPR